MGYAVAERAAINYYEHHLGDYLRDTAHLSMLEDGAYRRLLDAYYIRRGPFQNEKKFIYRIARATSRNEKSAVDIVLAEFFFLADDGWHHKRCDQEIARFLGKRDKAKASADARWNPTERNANAMRTHSDGNALQTPDSSHQTPDKNLRSSSVRSFRPSSSETAESDVLKNGRIRSAVAEASAALGVIPK